MKGRLRAANPADSRGVRAQAGFTVNELAVVILILGITFTIAGVSYANVNTITSLVNAAKDAKAAMERSYNIALQEGVDVYLRFFSRDDANHPNTYAIYRVTIDRSDPAYPVVESELDTDEPTETYNPGGSYVTDGLGHYWFTLADGAVSIPQSSEFLFQRRGAVVRVTQTEGSEMSVLIERGGRSRTVTISETGEVASF